MKLIFYDTETTSLKKDAEIIQLAYSYKKDNNKIQRSEIFSSEKPTEIEAMAIHHITKEHQDGKVKFADSEMFQEFQQLLKDGYIPVAHNASFDNARMKYYGLDIRHFICTQKIAMYIDEESRLNQYNLQYLRYYFGVKVIAQSHDALGDVNVLVHVFNKIFDLFNLKKIATVQDLINISIQPKIIRKMPFGKHKGIELKKVPKDYIFWLMSQDFDDDLKFNLKKYL